MQLDFLLLAAIAGFTLAATTPKTQAQISVNIGVAPNCPYGYDEAAPYNCAPTATTVLSGLRAASSSVLASGFMALPTFKVM